MKLKNLSTTLATVVLSTSCFVSSAFAGLVVSQNDSANALVNNILGTGITASSATTTGASAAFGTFTGGVSAGIGIESGIMLSSGNVYDAVGPNTSASTTGYNNSAGDPDLMAIAGHPTYDAAALTFDFTSDGGDVFFNYVFASEEYNEYVGSQYNDVFGFFLDGSNIALIPETETPVAINNVNNGINSDSYNDNSAGYFNIEYDGFTDVFTASLKGLTEGTHKISLKIADAGDSSLDSTVFIQAGSFSDEEDIPEPSVLALIALGLFGLRARKVNK